MIYCASDLHIGHENANYPVINEFLELVRSDADELILCGDIFDLWVCPLDLIKNQEPTRTTYENLLKTAAKVPTRIVWGNHDYNLAGKIPVKVTDDFAIGGIHFCHGWRFDVAQWIGYPFFGWFVNDFPYIYQRFFRKPFGVRSSKNQALNTRIHNAAREFVTDNCLDYIVMGHTHSPIEDGPVVDCGDMVTSCTYVTIDRMRPRLEKM